MGHLEAYASGPAIVAEYVAGGGVAGCLEEVAGNARAGDELARAVIAAAGAILGTALGGLSNVLDPELIVVGGGAANPGELLFDPLEAALRRQALAGPDTVPVRPAGLGALAAVVGATSVALPARPRLRLTIRLEEPVPGLSRPAPPRGRGRRSGSGCSARAW